MRLKYTVVVLLIAVVGTTTMPVIGQEEPLPTIQARSSFEPLTPSIALAVDPIRDLVQRTTLADAARANDYAAFDALYRDAVQRGELVGAFAALHELWTFSMTDPVGAFYGQETYERLTRAYPGFARYIDEYRIVDAHGNAFYPTSETRTFLLDRALEGRAPRVQIAERGTRPAPRNDVSDTRASQQATPAVTPRRASAKAANPPAKATARDAVATVAAPKAAAKKAAVQPSAPAPLATAGKAPVAATEKPTLIVAEKVADPAVVAGQPAAPPADRATVKPEPATVAVENNVGTRGIFLLLIGIFGIGILAMMLRTPRELPASIMTPPAESTPPPVEPLRRPSAAAPQPPQQLSSNEKNRANGSRG